MYVSHPNSLIGCTALNKALQTVLENCNLQIFGLELGGVRQARALVQRMGDAREPQQQAAVAGSPPRKINLISCGPLGHVSDIKLIRTDTTLDLSQKAEKGMLKPGYDSLFYWPLFQSPPLSFTMWDFPLETNIIRALLSRCVILSKGAPAMQTICKRGSLQPLILS
jgi:hypothetical protein